MLLVVDDRDAGRAGLAITGSPRSLWRTHTLTRVAYTHEDNKFCTLVVEIRHIQGLRSSLRMDTGKCHIEVRQTK